MKRTKKIAAVLFALVMMLCFTATAFAANTGSITISNPVANETYKAYKMFDLRSYDASTNAYSYRVTSDWENFVKGAGAAYLDTDNNGYVYVKDGESIADNSETAAALAQAAIKYANDNGISATATLNSANGYKAEGLDLGYYVVDSSLGTLCALTTTNTDATVTEKNDQPTIDKVVKENSTNTWARKMMLQLATPWNSKQQFMQRRTPKTMFFTIR